MFGSTEKQLPLPDGGLGRVHAGRSHLLEVPAVRLRVRRRRDRAPVAVPARRRLTARSSRPARTTARWCGRSASTLPRLRLFVFALGVALAAIAGIVMSPIWGIRPHVGVDAVVPAFLIIVLGGVGSFWGAVIAALLVGLVVGLARRLRLGMVAAVDVSAVHRRGDVPQPRLVRQEERAGCLRSAAPLRGKVALVAGGYGGIGEACAQGARASRVQRRSSPAAMPARPPRWRGALEGGAAQLRAVRRT